MKFYDGPHQDDSLLGKEFIFILYFLISFFSLVTLKRNKKIEAIKEELPLETAKLKRIYSKD